MENYVYEGKSGADVRYNDKGFSDDYRPDGGKDKPCKIITETKKLAGVKFELRAKCGCVIACGKTNENGELKFDGLPNGTYFLTEVESNKGWECDSKPICVEICDENPHKCVEVVNTKDCGSIKLIKYGKEDRFVCDGRDCEYKCGR